MQLLYELKRFIRVKQFCLKKPHNNINWHRSRVGGLALPIGLEQVLWMAANQLNHCRWREKKERVRSRRLAKLHLDAGKYKSAALPFATLLLCSLQIGCMCCCRAIHAAATLIGSHAGVYFAKVRALSLPLLLYYRQFSIEDASEFRLAASLVIRAAIKHWSTWCF